jgi:hypothetical protein
MSISFSREDVDSNKGYWPCSQQTRNEGRYYNYSNSNNNKGNVRLLKLFGFDGEGIIFPPSASKNVKMKIYKIIIYWAGHGSRAV